MWTKSELGPSNWNDINDIILKYNVRNFKDWRLPTIEELTRFHIYLKNSNQLNIYSNDYWSSSDIDWNSNDATSDKFKAWYIVLKSGIKEKEDKKICKFLILVRNF